MSVYEVAGFVITRNTSPGRVRWRGWSPDHGTIAADTLAGARDLAREKAGRKRRARA